WVKEIHLPSGDHCGLVTAQLPKATTSPRVTMLSLPSATVQWCRARSLAVYNSDCESGDQTSELFCARLLVKRFRFSPNSSHSQISSLPLRSLMKAMRLPSGDHCGCVSRTSEVRVKRRASPRSVAMVNSSPCVARTARLPDGDKW